MIQDFVGQGRAPRTAAGDSAQAGFSRNRRRRRRRRAARGRRFEAVVGADPGAGAGLLSTTLHYILSAAPVAAAVC